MSVPDGWLTQAEADELTRLAAGKVVLELGSYLGRSTLALARSARQVVTIDHHLGFRVDDEVYEETLYPYFENVRGLPNVVSIVGPFSAALLFRPDAFGLVFIDGVHDEGNQVADMVLGFSFKAAVTAVHDWGRFSLPKIADSFRLEPDFVVDHLAVFTGARE